MRERRNDERHARLSAMSLPGDCEQFASAMCDRWGERQRFWSHRGENQRHHGAEHAILMLTLLRARQRFLRFRPELQEILGCSPGTMNTLYQMHNLLLSEAPVVHRASSKVEGELAGVFVADLAERYGLVEASDKGFAMCRLWEEHMVYINLYGGSQMHAV